MSIIDIVKKNREELEDKLNDLDVDARYWGSTTDLLISSHLQILEALKEEIREEIWQYHTLGQFKDKWGISKEMEDDLNDMFMAAHNSALSSLLSTLQSSIDEIKKIQ